MLNRPFPIHRSDDTYDPEEYAAITRELNKMAEEDPAMREFAAAWNEVTAAFEQREREAQECEAQECEVPSVRREEPAAAKPLKKAA